ncbi:hypothetical protein PaeBR_11970 [Paenibacillus sp. BR2-3]|uniref:hypothetical protein n=1 Tax=Paenibacillus sp. BR2-3 TaxID=3048494 RepID=UPI00397772B9
MIKNRSFMIGLGSGLVAGALLLQLMNSAGVAEPSKEQIIKEAAKLNLKVSDQAEKLLTQEEWAALQEQNMESGGEGGNAANSGTLSQPAAGISPSPAAAPDAAASPAPPSTPGEVQLPAVSAAPAVTMAPASSDSTIDGVVSLRIPNGSTLRDVANLLTMAGVIQDKSGFLRAADSRGITKVIQYGKYSFNKGESLDSIIKKLTTAK